MDVLRLALFLPERGDGGDLFFGDEGCVDALHAAGAGGKVEHVALAEEGFGAVAVDDGARIDLGGQAEADAGGDVGLDEAGDDIDGWALRGQHKMDADGAGHLREAGDGLFDVGAVEHHQVGELVDDDDDVGQRLLVGVVEEVVGVVVEELVELVDVADVVGGEQLEAALHLAHGVAQGVGGQLDVGDDGGEEVGDALVHAQLDALGIDQDHADLLGRGLEEHGHDHGVDGDGFSRSRRTRDEDVGHGGEVGGDDAAVDVLAEGDGELGFALDEGLALDYVAQPDGLAAVVRHLDADGGFAGHALDEDRFGGHGEAEVVGQACDAGVLDAGVGVELECGDDGAGVDLSDLAVDAELGALLDEGAGFGAQGFFADDGNLVGAVEQRGGRELVAADGLWGDGDLLEVCICATAEGDGVRLGAGGERRGLRGGRRLGGGRLRMARGRKIGKFEARGLVCIAGAERGGGGGQLGGEGRGGGGCGAERGRGGRIDMSARHGLPDRGGRFYRLIGGGIGRRGGQSLPAALASHPAEERGEQCGGRGVCHALVLEFQLHSRLLEGLFAAAGKDLMAGFRREGGLQREGRLQRGGVFERVGLLAQGDVLL